MIARKRFENLNKLERRLSRAMDELAVLQSLAERVTSAVSATPRAPGVKKGMEESVLKIMEKKDAVGKAYEEYVAERQKISDELDGMDDGDCADVLRYRYLNGMTWREVAKAMHTGERNVYRLHAKALSEFSPD